MLTTEINLTDHALRALEIAQIIARENNHGNYTAEHLLLGLLNHELDVTVQLKEAALDRDYLYDWAEVRLEQLSKGVNTISVAAADHKIELIINEAQQLAAEAGRNQTTAIDLLQALITPGVVFQKDQLKSLPFTSQQLQDKVNGTSPKDNASGKINTEKSSSGVLQQTKGAYANNLRLKLSKSPKKIIGYKNALRSIAQILTRKAHGSVLIHGESGVGKTSLIYGFVQALNDGAFGQQYADMRVFELDTTSLVIGTSYKSESVNRLKKTLEELGAGGQFTLFIDDFGLLINDPVNGTELKALLKSKLSQGGFTLIVACLPEIYKTAVESDASFQRIFELIKLEEPDQDLAFEIVRSVSDIQQSKYALIVEDAAVQKAISFVKRYRNERSLPASAIALIDQTLAAYSFMRSASAGMITKFQEELLTLEGEEEQALKTTRLNWLHREILEACSYLLTAHLPERLVKVENVHLELLKELVDILKQVLDASEEIINADAIAATIADQTGIPIGKVSSSEKEKLANMEQLLSQRVIGQDGAVQIVTSAIMESRSGLLSAGQPIGSFFFLGPTGTGKTELAKALAAFLFDSEEAIIRFDMSEFKEEHSAALLYGAPPGYVGYSEGGLLINKIRQKPYSVVLFDEIEKAHTSVFDIFLQIMDEGKVHDRLGKMGDFSNAIVLFTSNLGSDYIANSFHQGAMPQNDRILEIMKGHFRPEFLARLTSIVPFSPIKKETAERIFDIQLSKLKQLLDQKRITLDLEDSGRDKLVDRGFNPEYGARPIKDVIRKYIRSPLSRKIIAGELKENTQVTLDFDDDLKPQWGTSNNDKD